MPTLTSEMSKASMPMPETLDENSIARTTAELGVVKPTVAWSGESDTTGCGGVNATVTTFEPTTDGLIPPSEAGRETEIDADGSCGDRVRTSSYVEPLPVTVRIETTAPVVTTQKSLAMRPVTGALNKTATGTTLRVVDKLAESVTTVGKNCTTAGSGVGAFGGAILPAEPGMETATVCIPASTVETCNVNTYVVPDPDRLELYSKVVSTSRSDAVNPDTEEENRTSNSRVLEDVLAGVVLDRVTTGTGGRYFAMTVFEAFWVDGDTPGGSHGRSRATSM